MKRIPGKTMGRTLKVVVVGGRSVGKTAILERVILGALHPEKSYVPTIEDIYVGYVETEKGNKEKVRFYDTAGFDIRNRSIPTHYHAVADAYILVFSLTDRLSFQLLVDMKKDIEKNREKKDVPFIVLGNKQDLIKDRVIDAEMAESWAITERLRYWETSIHNRQSLIEPLVFLTSKLAPQPNKTTFPQLSMGRKNKD